MKKKSLFKSKTQMIIYIILYIICIVLFIIIGTKNYKKEEISDSKKFSSLYNFVDDNNVYKFSDANEVLNIINGRSGIILMGFPTNKWTNYYAKILNDVAKELNIKEVYYYDFLQDRDESNGTYETIVNKLKVYAPVNDEGIQDLGAPTLLVVKNGDIIAYFDDTSIVKGVIQPEDYYNENQKALTYEYFKTALLKYND